MERLTLAGAAGDLEAVLDGPDGEPVAAVLLCHPHPPSGGTMHTHAVYRAMKAFCALGCVVLRFNFRGVGASAGAWDEGRGERLDGKVALEVLRRRWPTLPLLSGGFSFGAWVGMHVGVEGAAQGLIGLGVPYRGYSYTEVERSRLPKAFVLAERDEFTSVSAMELGLSHMAGASRLWIVPETTHLFTERLDDYQQRVTEAGRWLLGELNLPPHKN